MDGCAASVVGGIRWWLRLGAFALFQGRHYENHSTFFSLVPRGAEKIYFQNESTALPQGATSKTITFLETTWKISYTVPIFYLFVTSSSGGVLGLKIGTCFSNISHQNNPMVLVLRYVVESVNVRIKYAK